MSTLATLRDQLLGARVVRLEGVDGADGPRLTEIAFDGGLYLRFHWAAGVGDEVGVVVGRTTRLAVGRVRRRVECAK